MIYVISSETKQNKTTLFCLVIPFLLPVKFGCRDDLWIIGLPPGKACFFDDFGCLKTALSSMLSIDKVRISAFTETGSCISFLNGKYPSKHNWETRITVCHYTGLLCPFFSTLSFLPVGNMVLAASWISSSCEWFPCISSGSHALSMIVLTLVREWQQSVLNMCTLCTNL